jgi:prolactin regulatory element-binding protein
MPGLLKNRPPSIGKHSCRLYRWESKEGEGPQRLALEPDQDALAELKDVGFKLVVSFSGEASILAFGGKVS